jgi:hypothetical protein
MRRLLAAAVAALVLPQGANAATPTAKNLGCGAGRLALSVTYTVSNDVDTGLRGNNWAFDDYTRTLRVVSKGNGRWCAGSTYAGTFTTIAGPSPGGTTTIPAGIRGTFEGSSVTTFRGTFSPRGKRTRGSLGAHDFQCTSDAVKGKCAATWDWLTTYFTSPDSFASFRYLRYAFSYRALEGGHGAWTDKLVGGKERAHGDIVGQGKKKKKGG